MPCYYPVFAMLSESREAATQYVIIIDTNAAATVIACLLLAGFQSVAGSNAWTWGQKRAVVYTTAERQDVRITGTMAVIEIDTATPLKSIEMGAAEPSARGVERGVNHQHLSKYWTNKVLSFIDAGWYSTTYAKPTYFATTTGEVYTELGPNAADLRRHKYMIYLEVGLGELGSEKKGPTSTEDDSNNEVPSLVAAD